MLFISPPFGNYLSLPKTVTIKGSYTLYPRTGLFAQIIKTLRYSSLDGGWINKIGLRNPGIDYAIKYYKPNSDYRKNKIIKEFSKFQISVRNQNTF